MPIHSQELIDRDELYKLTSASSRKSKKSIQKVFTQYHYICNSEIGHYAKASLHKLIKLTKFSDCCDQIALTEFDNKLPAYLNKLIIKERTKIMCLCNLQNY